MKLDASQKNDTRVLFKQYSISTIGAVEKKWNYSLLKLDLRD